MMKIVWFKRAIRDLESLREYISQEDPQAARFVVQRIRESVVLLGDQPGIGRPGRVPETRELVVPQTPYILPYQVRDGRVVILRVLHAARQWPEHF